MHPPILVPPGRRQEARSSALRLAHVVVKMWIRGGSAMLFILMHSHCEIFHDARLAVVGGVSVVGLRLQQRCDDSSRWRDTPYGR